MIPDTQEWGGRQFLLVELFMHGNEPASKMQRKKDMFELKSQLDHSGDVITHYIYDPPSSTYALYKSLVNPVPE